MLRWLLALLVLELNLPTTFPSLGVTNHETLSGNVPHRWIQTGLPRTPRGRWIIYQNTGIDSPISVPSLSFASASPSALLGLIAPHTEFV